MDGILLIVKTIERAYFYKYGKRFLFTSFTITFARHFSANYYAKR
ncbi:MAG TPA: hypothetical protein PK987_04690 [Ferruginibacter sp.]|nr:hypothetical protein [Ferruginibacter sp.]